MSGGKGGSKTTEKALPDWLRGPAERNLQRAEAVQQIEYMPYYGPDVAAFTPAQNAAFDANIGAAEAFGLLAPNTLTATSGMPTPTDFDGFSGYSSQPIYESALAELQAKQPGAVAQYNALFGNATPALLNRGGGSRFRGSAGGNPPAGRQPITTSGWPDGGVAAAKIMDDLNADRGKIIRKDAAGKFLPPVSTGEEQARKDWLAIEKSPQIGSYGAGGINAVKNAEQAALAVKDWGKWVGV